MINWDECRTKRLVKETRADLKVIASLINESKKKLATDKYSPLNKVTASTKITNNYDSLREVLEAVALSRGFKIYNHECFVGFLKEIVHLEEEAEMFNRFRKIRNGINYYGQNISVKEGKFLIKDILKLRRRLMGVLNEK